MYCLKHSLTPCLSRYPNYSKMASSKMLRKHSFACRAQLLKNAQKDCVATARKLLGKRMRKHVQCSSAASPKSASYKNRMQGLGSNKVLCNNLKWFQQQTRLLLNYLWDPHRGCLKWP